MSHAKEKKKYLKPTSKLQSYNYSSEMITEHIFKGEAENMADIVPKEATNYD